MESKDGIEIVGGHYGETRFFEEVGTGSLGHSHDRDRAGAGFQPYRQRRIKNRENEDNSIDREPQSQGELAYLAEQFIKGGAGKRT